MSSFSASTSVGLVLSKPSGANTSDPFYSQRVQVVLWALTSSSSSAAAAATTTDSTDKETSAAASAPPTLTYYSYWDHPRQDFSHTDALLQRLAPVKAIHVAAGEGLILPKSTTSTKNNNNNNNNNKKTHTKIVQQFLEFLQDRQLDYTAQRIMDQPTEETAPTAGVVEFHASSGFRSATGRLTAVLSDLVDDPLRIAGDVQLSTPSSPVAQSCVFFLQAVGLWEGTTNDQDGTMVKYRVEPGVLTSHLYLDRTAAEAIHLWPPQGLGQTEHVGGSKHTSSLAGVLSGPCCTVMAQRLLESWLRQPLVSLEKLQTRQEAVAWLVHHSVARDAMRQEGLKLFAGQDLAKLVAVLERYSNSNSSNGGDSGEDLQESNSKESMGPTRQALQAIYQLYTVASQKLPLLLEQVETGLLQQGTDSTVTSSVLLTKHVLEPLRTAQASLARSVELASAVLDLNAAPREFLVQSSYKEELADLRTELQDVQDELQSLHNDMNEQWAELSGKAQAVRLENTNSADDEWQFRLPDANDSKLLQQLDVKVHRILKNGVYFSSKPLRQLATKQHDLLADYDRHQRQVALDAVQVASTYAPVLEQVHDAVALLDVLSSLAHVAAYSPHGYCRPTLTDSDQDGAGIELIGARHPCVELQENMEYIPNDIRLIFGDSNFLLVTGPNMGGKSTYIRALGAIVTLAQIGAFVPCTSAKINICHHILARVGAGDLQERGISTFMAEMLESSSILRTATKRSLIIVDELGRGTSTFDGYGLARAISEYMIQKIGCMTVFATHFHELTAMEEQFPQVQNCHVTAQKASQGLTFLYQVKPGPCLESFGIQVAEMAHVPSVVIEDAKRKAKELENFEYRSKKARSEQGKGSGKYVDPEESAAAMSWLNKFRKLPKSLLSAENSDFGSSTERRKHIMQLLEAA